MAWNINARGMIDITPLVGWETAIAQDMGCAIRLVLANPPGASQTTTTVQTILTVPQAEQLISDLQKMVNRILANPKDNVPKN